MRLGKNGYYLFYLLLFSLNCNVAFCQKHKEGDQTINSNNQIVNEYTSLSVDASIGDTWVTVDNNLLNANNRFGAGLEAGDLLLIIQCKGAETNIGIDGQKSKPSSTLYGEISSYYNSGNYELAEVESISGSFRINLTCALKKNYSVIQAIHSIYNQESNKDISIEAATQVIRVPRYNNLTVASGEIVPEDWDGKNGGIVAIECENLTVASGARIHANEMGFRGGLSVDREYIQGAEDFGSSIEERGARKGESIAGNHLEYAKFGAVFCRGGIANAGGGGNAQNAGGGGGGNAGQIAYNGRGNPDVSNPAYATAWDLELPSFSTNISSGGGKGGYSYSSINANALVTQPRHGDWGGDARKELGGFGGRPLDYSTGRIFMGGGGGAGEQDTNPLLESHGGNGGGIIFIVSHNAIEGAGKIESNGQNGGDCKGTVTFFDTEVGTDGGGGGGAGGAILLLAKNGVSGIETNAAGGKGGDQVYQSFGNPSVQAAGPGGGGGGGYVQLSGNNGVAFDITGGDNGTTNSVGMTEFPPNGATMGGEGLYLEEDIIARITIEDDTVCYKDTYTGTFTTQNISGNPQIHWYDASIGGNSLTTSSTYSIPQVLATDTLYIGYCNNFYREPVIIHVTQLKIEGTIILGDGCAADDASITGIQVSEGASPYQYWWNGQSFATADVTGLSTIEEQIFVVEDKNGCRDTMTFNHGSESILNIDTTGISRVSPTCGNANGSINGVTTSGGWKPYDVYWTDDNGDTVLTQLDVTNLSVLQNVISGIYSVSVVDSIGCEQNSAPFTLINSGVVVSGTEVITNESCGLKNGSIVGIIASGGGGNYTYSWDNGTSSTTTADLTGLGVGSYELTVSDGSGCSIVAGVYSIGSASSLAIDENALVVTAPLCGEQYGEISGLTVSGGTGNYTYFWKTTSGGFTVANLGDLDTIPGDYTLVVTDNFTCTKESSLITIPASTGGIVIAGTVVVDDEICANGKGSITGITVSGGDGNYSYLWSNGVINELNLVDVSQGQYKLIIEDGNGCSDSTSLYTVDNVRSLLIATNPVIKEATCGEDNGRITGIVISGAGGDLSYSWDNGITSKNSFDSTGLAVGTYTILVKDTAGCQLTVGPLVVNGGTAITLASIPTISNASCGANNGSITGVSIVGGDGNYTYSWDNGATTADLLNVKAGSYLLTVEDGNGCKTISPQIPIIDDGNMSLTVASLVEHISCSILVGKIEGITASGGDGNYTYTWNHGANTADVSNLIAGDYELIVEDGNSCSISSGIITIDSLVGIRINTTNSTVVQPDCGQTNGSITGIEVTGGTGNYTYSWATGGETTLDLQNIGKGTYILNVGDDSNCSILITLFVVDEKNVIELVTSPQVIPEDCGQAIGEILGLTVQGGDGNYTYTWDNGSVSTSTADLTDLTSGDYNLTVTDNSGCSFLSAEYTVLPSIGVDVQGTAVITAATCGQSNGSITGFTATGGTGTLNFEWSNGNQNNDLVAEAAGSYQLVVSDSLGCTDSTALIILPDNGSVSIDGSASIVNDVCSKGEGNLTGLSISGGDGNYTYEWNGIQSTSIDLIDTIAGIYQLTVVDGAGCSDVSSLFEIKDSGNLMLAGTAQLTPAGCSMPGAITGLNVSGGDGSYQYVWSDGTSTTSQDRIDLTAGNVSFIVADGNGCFTISDTFTVQLNSAITIDTASLLILPETCGKSNGSIEGIVASGGTGSLTFSWNGNIQSLVDLQNIDAGKYLLEVEDQSGCIAKIDSLIVQVSSTPLINGVAVVIDADCITNLGSISGLSVSGGVGPYNLSWNNLYHTMDISASAGNYVLKVQDSNLCEVVSDTFEIKSITDLKITGTAAYVEPNWCSSTTTLSGLLVEGGTAPYTYLWNTGQTTLSTVLVDVSVGEYVLSVTDSLGCVAVSDSIYIEQNEFAINGDSVVCLGDPIEIEISTVDSFVIDGNGIASINGTTVSYLPLSSGYITITSYLDSCIRTDFWNVTVHTIDSSVFETNPIYSIGSFQADVKTQYENLSFLWSDSQLSCSDCAEPNGSILEDAVFPVLFQDTTTGCIGVDTLVVYIAVEEAFLPSAFSPNNDGNNDSFGVIGLISIFEEFQLMIYDRWGEKVFETSDPSIRWDGTFRGTPVNSGMYVFVLKATYLSGEPVEKKGNLYIHR